MVSTSATGTYSVGGLASGIDTEALVSAYLDLQRARLITPLEDRITEIEEKKTALESINTNMAALEASARSLNSVTFQSRAGESSDTDVISISSVSATAVVGSYDINVTQLAQADRIYFDGEADSTMTQFGTGTITISVDGVSIDVEITSSNNTLAGIKDAINAAEDSPVTASIVNDGSGSPYRLVLTSNDTGASSTITQNIHSILTGLSVDAALSGAAVNEAEDAAITVNGLSVSSSTNNFSSVIPGVSFSVLNTHTDVVNPIRVNIDYDYTTTMQTIANFLNSYNQVVLDLKEQFTYNAETETAGPLASDATLQSIQARLYSIFIGVYNSLGANEYKTLNSIGVNMTTDNYLQLDEDELRAALENNHEAVETLFKGTDTVDGISSATADYMDLITNETNGLNIRKIEVYDDTMDDLNELIETRQDRIDAFEANMRARFAYMEEVVSSLQAQGDAITQLQTSLQNMANSNR